MTEAQHGHQVKVKYTGKLQDGTVFDQAGDDAPLEFTIGSGEVIPGFEEAVVGMRPGEARTTDVPADQAYGEYRDDLLVQVSRDQFPSDIQPEVDQQLQVQTATGELVPVTVREVDEDQVTLDANHPLAGEDLVFEVELLEVS